MEVDENLAFRPSRIVMGCVIDVLGALPRQLEAVACAVLFAGENNDERLETKLSRVASRDQACATVSRSIPPTKRQGDYQPTDARQALQPSGRDVYRTRNLA